MEKLSGLIAELPDRHRAALQWFIDHAGLGHPWPDPLPDGTFLTTKAKGIYKPEWSRYALSVRQTINSPYPDQPPFARADGTWAYSYFQENTNVADRDTEYANRGLIACWQDKVPVGVMRQTSGKPNVQYHILGVALVAGWDGGYFFLEGFSADGRSHNRGPQAEIERLTLREAKADYVVEPFTPDSMVDARQWIIASIIRRQGQPEFRKKLLEAYSGRCAVTGYDAVEALEAAHIIPYRGTHTNHPSNGLLLRADIHTLYDLGLLAIDTETLTVLIAPSLASTAYGELAGVRLRIPEEETCRPSLDALKQHRVWSGL